MIYGERVRFRAAEKADLPIFVRWLNDPEVRRGILIYNPISQAEEEGIYERMLARPVDEHWMVIEVKQAGASVGEEVWQTIGNCAFDHIDWQVRAAEFGILIGEKSYWNQGYGTEAVRLLTHHGFATLNLHRIFLHVFANNPRAIRAYEKAGFTEEGRERQDQFMEGQFIDVIRMSLLSNVTG